MPDQSPFTLHTAICGTGAVAVLGGALDLTNAAELDRALARLRETAPPTVVLDMAGVQHLDAAAARVIAAATRDWPCQGRLVIRDPGRSCGGYSSSPAWTPP